MSSADIQYLNIIEEVLEKWFYADNRTGIPAYKLPHKVMTFDLEKEFPILTTKFVAFKTAVKELLLIYRDQSNDVRVLQKVKRKKEAFETPKFTIDDIKLIDYKHHGKLDMGDVTV